jgi:hypothetical protein
LFIFLLKNQITIFSRKDGKTKSLNEETHQNSSGIDLSRDAQFIQEGHYLTLILEQIKISSEDRI